jgi:hypothetical protein
MEVIRQIAVPGAAPDTVRADRKTRIFVCHGPKFQSLIRFEAILPGLYQIPAPAGNRTENFTDIFAF